MSYQDDVASLYDFLLHTSESNLKKMLVDGKMTMIHVNLLLKIVKSTSLEQFASHYEKKDFPKIKVSAKEQDIREHFWETCEVTLQSRGLIGSMPQAA